MKFLGIRKIMKHETKDYLLESNQEFIKRCVVRLEEWLDSLDALDEVKCWYYHEFGLKALVNYRVVRGHCSKCTHKYECYIENFLPTMQPVETPESLAEE